MANNYRRYHKTPQAERATYKQLDDNGHVIATLDPNAGENSLFPAEMAHEEKVAMVKELHHMDDSECYYNNKTLRLAPHLKEAIRAKNDRDDKEFEQRYGYPRDPELRKAEHAVTLSIQQYEQNDKEAENGSPTYREIKAAMSTRLHEDNYTAVDHMRDLVERLLEPNLIKYYKLVYVDNMRKKDAAVVLNVTPKTISAWDKKLREILAGQKSLSRYFT